MTRSLITGADGFIGRHLSNFIRTQHPTADLILAGRQWDLTAPDACARLLEESGAVDYVFHLADVSGNARWAANHSADQFFANAKISLNILEAVRRHQPNARFVGVSSLWAYPAAVTQAREDNYWDGPLERTTQQYGVVKKFLGSGLHACKQQDGMKGTMLVLGSVYGPGDHSDHVIPTLIQRMAAHPEVLEVWGDGSETRDFVYVEDQVRGIYLHKDFDGDLLNISSGASYSIREVVETLVRLLGYSGRVTYSGALARSMGARRLVVDRARQETGWTTAALRSLEDGLRLTLQDAR